MVRLQDTGIHIHNSQHYTKTFLPVPVFIYHKNKINKSNRQNRKCINQPYKIIVYDCLKGCYISNLQRHQSSSMMPTNHTPKQSIREK